MQQPTYEPDFAQRRSRRTRRLAMLGGAFPLMAVVVWVIMGMSSDQEESRLTHKIGRGDLVVTVVEHGILESSENTEIKNKVWGLNPILWVVESGTIVKPGEELIRIDSSFIEEQIDERTKYALWSRSAAERSAADLAEKELRVPEYEEGRYVTELMRREKDLFVAERSLRNAVNQLKHTRLMAESDYASVLEVEDREFRVSQSRRSVEARKSEIEVLRRFTYAEQIQTLKGDLGATRARHDADAERATADASRRDRVLEQLEKCVIRAERGGLVIHPNAARWRNAPLIAEGVSVWTDQTVLLMPDLSKMQVKVGIREAMIDRVAKGFSAKVTLPDKTIDGTVESIASVTRPSGWWTGNVVRYDTIIKLPADEHLRPGMSAEVEVTIAEYEDVLTIPVASIVKAEEGVHCWVKTSEGSERRKIVLGDSNDIFTIVKEGLQEGEEVVLNPVALGAIQPETTTSNETKESLRSSGQS